MRVFLEPEEKREIEQLNSDTPTLRVRDQGKPQEPEETIATALAERTGTAACDLRTRLDAVLIAGVLRVAVDRGLDAVDAGASAGDHVRQVGQTLEANLSPVGSCSNLRRQRGCVRHPSKMPACGHSASFGV